MQASFVSFPLIPFFFFFLSLTSQGNHKMALLREQLVTSVFKIETGKVSPPAQFPCDCSYQTYWASITFFPYLLFPSATARRSTWWCIAPPRFRDNNWSPFWVHLLPSCQIRHVVVLCAQLVTHETHFIILSTIISFYAVLVQRSLTISSLLFHTSLSLKWLLPVCFVCSLFGIVGGFLGFFFSPWRLFIHFESHCNSSTFRLRHFITPEWAISSERLVFKTK